MPSRDEIDLNDIIPTLHRARSSYLEFYERAGPTRKSLNEIDTDVWAAVSALARLGLPPRARVGILGWTSYQWIIVDLACLAKGFLTVPLDPEVSWDGARLAEMFELDLVLTNHADYSASGGHFMSFESVCRGKREDGPPDDGELDPATWDQDEAFTLTFTSGTSGEPKAIEVKKRCFDDQFSNALRMFEITPRDKMLVFLPMHIYLERCYVYLAILRGFSVVVVSPSFIVKALRNAEFTFTVGVPQFFETLQEMFLLQVKSSAGIRLRCSARLLLLRFGLGSLLRRPFSPFKRMLGGAARFCLTGSAPCPLSVLQFYRALGVPVFEGYGMSEIAGMVSLNYPGHTKLGTVGKVFPNKEVKLDADGQILVRGENVANTGYWRASDEVNAATFLHDGWVATGDVGHFDRDGYLTIVGRIKDVIALSNGRKVQPGPIEREINRIGHVDHSVVLGDERPYLVALVSVNNSSIGHSDLREYFRHLNQSRPDAERVKRFHVLDERFTVDNGLLNRGFKLNRKKIKERYAGLIDKLYAS